MAKNKSKIDPKNEFCSNENCNDCGKRDSGNIVKFGHDRNGKQRFKCYNNLNRVNSALEIKTKKGEKNIRRTPCMAEEITDHIWSWKELLMSKVGISIIDKDSTKDSVPVGTSWLSIFR